MAKLFFFLSGEHPTLPASELTAILEAEGYSFSNVEKLDQTLRAETSVEALNAVKKRAALTRVCGLELFQCKAEYPEIMKNANKTSFERFLREGETFVVRVKRVKLYGEGLDVLRLERKLGEAVLKRNPRAKVNLKEPEKTFFGVITCGKFIFGLKLAEIAPKEFVNRSPCRKPFFHPSAMTAKLARCMVNLAKPKPGDLVFDPFCGTGSMLIEAGLIGCRVLGLDAKRKMVEGTRRNLEFFHIRPEGLVVADAKKLPIKRVDCVVTDPPYGRSATTLGWTTREIVEQAFGEFAGILEKGRRVCLAAPKAMKVGEVGEEYGFKHRESHFVYVHRSLTREIAVFERVL